MYSTDRLERLTPAQESLLPAIRDKWIAIGLSTAPADRPRAEAAVRLAYRRAGLAPPTYIVWAGSPMGGAMTAAALPLGRAGPGATAAVEVRSQVTCDVTSRASDMIAAQVSTQVRHGVMHDVATHVAAQVWGPVKHQIERQIGSPIEGAGYGQHDAHWIAFYDALGRCGVDVLPLDGLTEIAASAGWWWPFRDVCILTERPSRLERDAHGRLHAAAGPAVVYPDGWSIYAWHGVCVSETAILNPELLTLDQIQQEANTEVRRVLLERYGFDRYITDTGAVPIHADDTGTLYRCELDGDEPLVAVSVLNATPEADASRKRYVLRVPPHITQAREAVAWTFGQAAEDYKPLIES